MQVNDHRYDLVVEAIRIIGAEIPKKIDSQRIKKKIIEKMNYNERHFDRIFREVTGSSLIEFIKNARYEYAAKKMINEDKKPNMRQTYEGIPHFRFNYNRRQSKGEKMKDILTAEELKEIKKMMESDIVEECEIENGNFKIKFDIDLVLLHALSMPKYFIPQRLSEEINFGELSQEDKKFVLISVRKYEGKLEEIEVQIPIEEFENEYMMLDLYDLENPTIINEMCIYSMNLSDNLKPMFDHIVRSILYQTRLMIPNEKCDALLDYMSMFDAIEKCKGFISIERLALKCGKPEEEIIDKLWELAKMGLLHVGENF